MIIKRKQVLSRPHKIFEWNHNIPTLYCLHKITSDHMIPIKVIHSRNQQNKFPFEIIHSSFILRNYHSCRAKPNLCRRLKTMQTCWTKSKVNHIRLTMVPNIATRVIIYHSAIIKIINCNSFTVTWARRGRLRKNKTNLKAATTVTSVSASAASASTS